MNMKMRWLLALAYLLSGGNAAAHENEPMIVPDAEREQAAELRASGPAENRGVESVRNLGKVDLTGEFESPDGRILRVREIVIKPGGVVAVHQHQSRPGMAYILEGEIVEHRNDSDDPVARNAGAVSFEKTGVTHWWENKSNGKVRALVVDIVPAP